MGTRRSMAKKATPEDSTRTLNRKDASGKKSEPARTGSLTATAANTSRKRTWTSPAPEMVLGKAPRKKSGVAGQKSMAGRRFERRKKSGSKEKRQTSRTSASQPTGLREKKSGTERFRREAKRETPRIVTERVTNERDKDRVRIRGRLVPKKAPAEFPRRAAHARILHS